MNAVDVNFASALLGSITGAVLGGLATAAAFTFRRRPGSGVDLRTQVDRDLRKVSDFDEAATEWAISAGRPGAAPLVAEKMRLAEQLSRDQRPNWRRR